LIKTIIIIALLFSLNSSLVKAEDALDDFLKKYSDDIYQDLVIGNEIYPIGTDLCEPRYKLIKPIFNRYQKAFSVLDLGAAQGYFSFRIANDYPQSICVMIEANDTSYYSKHGDMLYDLCLCNQSLSNIFYLDKRMDLLDLNFLAKDEHFDVVIAFLVVHLMHDSLFEQIKIIECLLSLGDNLILEVANDVGVIHTSYVEFLSNSIDCQYLGEVKRHKNLNSDSTGKFYWFKKKTISLDKNSKIGLKQETFFHLNGKYPLNLMRE
jgi:hypothetical protein